jgi:hypothetical protein
VRDSVLRLTQFHRAACTLPEQDTDLSITLRDFMAALRGTGSDLTICRAGLLLAGTAESRRAKVHTAMSGSRPQGSVRIRL